MKMVTWNCRRATAKSALWTRLHSFKPDVILLQEVSSIPMSLTKQYDIISRRSTNKRGNQQPFSTVVAVWGRIRYEIRLRTKFEWVNSKLDRFAGNILCACAYLESGGSPLHLVSVYSPAWPALRSLYRLEGVNDVKLTLNKDVWVADLMRYALKERSLLQYGTWIVGGDFNLSETFDSCQGGPRGNREYLDKMSALGFIECLREYQGRLTPTFRNSRDGKIEHQIDHLFVTRDLASNLSCCQTGDPKDVFVNSLSDHLPVIASFNRYLL